MYYSKAVLDSQLQAKWAHITLFSSSYDFWLDFRICLKIPALTPRAPHAKLVFSSGCFNTLLLALVDCRSELVNCYPQEIKTIEYSSTPASFSGLWTLSTHSLNLIHGATTSTPVHSQWMIRTWSLCENLWLELLVIIQTCMCLQWFPPSNLQLLQIPNISFYLKQQRFIWCTWIMKFSSRTWKYSQIKV